MPIDLSKLAGGNRPSPGQAPLGQEGGIQALIQRLLGQAQGGGAFNPFGSDQIRSAVRRGALRRAQARRGQGSVLARLLGLNPSGQQQQILDTERAAAGDVSNEIGEADLGQMLGGQQFARGLLGQERGFEEQRMAQARADREARRARGGFGSRFGSLLGTGIGAFVGGPGGSILAKKLFNRQGD